MCTLDLSNKELRKIEAQQADQASQIEALFLDDNYISRLDNLESYPNLIQVRLFDGKFLYFNFYRLLLLLKVFNR